MKKILSAVLVVGLIVVGIVVSIAGVPQETIGRGGVDQEKNIDYDSKILEKSEENAAISSKSSYELSPDEAKAMLEEYLVDVNLLDDDSELCEQTISEIDGIDIYCFDVRFKEQVPNVGGRLIGMYGIATDGSQYYQYDIANGVWVEGNIYGYERGE